VSDTRADFQADPSSRLSRGALALLFLAAAALRVWVVLDYEAAHPFAERPVIDEASYESWALEIAAGDWLGDEVFFQEPLYPYALGTWYAVFGSDRTGWRIFQALLGALVAVQVARLGARLFGARAGALGGWVWALHGPALLFPALLLKPNLFLPILVLGVGWLVAEAERPDGPRWRRVGLGVALGSGALLRGNALILIPGAVLLPLVTQVAVHRRSLASGARAAAWVALGVALVLAPVALRNQHVGGVLALTTSGAGTNLYGGNNEHNTLGRATEFPWVRGIPEYEADDWRREAERRTGRALDPGQTSSFWMGELGRSIAADPALHGRILLNKLALTLGAYEVPDNHSYDWDRARLGGLRLWPVDLRLVGVLGLAGLVFACFRGRGGAGARMLAIAVGAYLLTIVLTVTSMRARLPLVPLLAPFAGFALGELWKLAQGRRRELGPWLVAYGVAAAAVWLPPQLFDLRSEDLDKRDFNAAVYWTQAGELERATEIASDLAARYPGTTRVELLLAHIEAEQAFHLEAEGLVDAAEARLQTALGRVRRVVEGAGVAPRERFRGHKLAGLIQARSGRLSPAARFLDEALEFDPDDEVVRFELAQVLFRRREGSDLERAEALLVELDQQHPESDYRAALEQVRAARGGP
jgi:4-amino-4-deoxy-L-arabinose transferase-like glycosyltransferase